MELHKSTNSLTGLQKGKNVIFFVTACLKKCTQIGDFELEIKILIMYMKRNRMELHMIYRFVKQAKDSKLYNFDF